MIALLAVYLIARDTVGRAWLPVLVTGLVAFDNLTLVHGRIGTLDMLVLAPMLLGSWLALRKTLDPGRRGDGHRAADQDHRDLRDRCGRCCTCS